jgi:hypothetical protein
MSETFKIGERVLIKNEDRINETCRGMIGTVVSLHPSGDPQDVKLDDGRTIRIGNPDHITHLYPGERKGKGNSMIDSFKKFYKNHEDVLFPLMIVIVLDHFFNNGALRERIVQIAQGLLDGIQSKLTPKQLPAKDEPKASEG